MNNYISTINNRHLTCTIRFEEHLKARPSEFSSFVTNKKPYFTHFASAFQLQPPEFYCKIGSQEIENVDHLPDEIGMADFSLVVQSQTVLSPERGYQLACAAEYFTKYWGLDDNSSLIVEIDGRPVKL